MAQWQSKTTIQRGISRQDQTHLPSCLWLTSQTTTPSTSSSMITQTMVKSASLMCAISSQDNQLPKRNTWTCTLLKSTHIVQSQKLTTSSKKLRNVRLKETTKLQELKQVSKKRKILSQNMCKRQRWITRKQNGRNSRRCQMLTT